MLKHNLEKPKDSDMEELFSVSGLYIFYITALDVILQILLVKRTIGSKKLQNQCVMCVSCFERNWAQWS